MKMKLKPELVKRDVIKLKFKLELVKIMNENEAETRTGENYKCN